MSSEESRIADEVAQTKSRLYHQFLLCPFNSSIQNVYMGLKWLSEGFHVHGVILLLIFTRKFTFTR
uniref:Uncharacterized protein n=1 Tax=Manihot esculenta TaxID=3983 RepID=A0A2C9WE78_MANES